MIQGDHGLVIQARGGADGVYWLIFITTQLLFKYYIVCLENCSSDILALNMLCC